MKVAYTKIQIPIKRYLVIFICFFLGFFNCYYSQENIKKFYEIGLSKKAFLDFTAQDAKAAAKVLAQKIFEKMDLNYSPKVRVFDDLSSIEKIIKNDVLHVVILTTPDYIKLRESVKVIPFSIPVLFDKTFARYSLIVNKNSGISNVSQLKDKKIIVLANADDENIFPILWINQVLNKKFKQKSNKFFSEIKITSVATDVILPVFFEKYDACILTEDYFKIQAELNPQINSKLTVMDNSDGYVIALFCFTSKGEKEKNQEILKAFYDMHKTTNGKQLLSVFKTDQLIPYKEEYIESVEKLLNDSLKE